MRRVAIALFGFVVHAFAQTPDASPAGLWQTFDDDTHAPKALVEIADHAGLLSGKIVKLFSTPGDDPDPRCKECTGERRNHPVLGMTILWNVRPDGANKWANGTILDPAKGKTYSSKVALVDNGRKLDVSGCIAFICRTQTWLRDQ